MFYSFVGKYKIQCILVQISRKLHILLPKISAQRMKFPATYLSLSLHVGSKPEKENCMFGQDKINQSGHLKIKKKLFFKVI